MLSCSWKESFGIECPTCGFQRSFIELIQGDIVESILLFPATIPLIVTFLILFGHLIFKLRSGAKAIILSFSFTVFLIVSNFVAKLI
jgi:hypothetical protein